MNRRRPTPKGFTNAPNADGPVDHDVPVLRVTDLEGKQLRAILFGYACHNTTLSFYQFCGDYAGFAQEYLEAAHPGAVAIFATGCGGDQNPYPRGTIELCRQHGRTLATAVDAALQTVPRPISGALDVAYGEVELEFAPLPPRDELAKLETSGNTNEKRRNALLKQLAEPGGVKMTYSYPIQVVHFGRALTLVALAGETVVDYSLRLKRELPGARLGRGLFERRLLICPLPPRARGGGLRRARCHFQLVIAGTVRGLGRGADRGEGAREMAGKRSRE